MTQHSLVDIWASVFPNPAWLVKKGHGSFLTFEFGQPELTIREPQLRPVASSEKVRQLASRRLVTVSGDWHLWIYCCNWSIIQNGVELSHNESSDDVIDRATNRLDGQKLKAVERGAVAGSWLFSFDLGGELQTRPYEGDQLVQHFGDQLVEQWMLFERKSGKVLTARSDGLCSYDPGDTPADSEVYWSKM